MNQEQEVSSQSNTTIAFIDKVEDGLLCTLLISMMLVAFVLIVMRNLFNVGLVWADPLLRQMVLWITMVGASITTRNNDHINVNIIQRFLPPRGKAIVQVFTNLFAGTIGGILTYCTLKLVMDEYRDPIGGEILAHVPLWVAETILPLAFLVITIRFFRYAIMSLIRSFSKKVEPTKEEIAAEG